VVDGPLDGTQYLGHDLPLVEQYRFGHLSERGIGVGDEGGGFRRPIEAYDGGSVAGRGGGLAGRPGTDEQDGRELSQQAWEKAIRQS
jgi:hypothetical protein